jgi:hypothetical protein
MSSFTSIILDISLPLSEVEEEDFMDYYIRMDKILQLERELIEKIDNQIQADMRAEEEEEELEYYINMFEEDENSKIRYKAKYE